MRATLCKRKGIPRNSCARSRICAHVRIFLAVFFVFAAASPSPFINSFKSAAFTTFTPQSLLGATAKEPVNCSVLLPSTPLIRHGSQTARLFTQGTSLDVLLTRPLAE